jgi:hypothetical protein
MTASITDQNSFVHVAVQGADVAYLSMVIDEFAQKRMAHGLLMQYQGGRMQRIAPAKWNVVSLAVLREPAPCVIALGETGIVLVASAGSVKQEDLNAEAAAGRLVPLRSVTTVGANAYAVGMRRQAYQRTPDGVWRPIHGNMLEAQNTDAVHGFETVLAVSDQEIYAAGWEGEIWRYDGKNWLRVPTPTNLIITGLALADNGRIHACGQAGLLLVGRGDDWEIAESGTQEDLWSIRSFKGRIFVAGFRNVFELKDDGLEVIADVARLTNSCYELSATAEVLWSVGPKSVLTFDGQQWRRMI